MRKSPRSRNFKKMIIPGILVALFFIIIVFRWKYSDGRKVFRPQPDATEYINPGAGNATETAQWKNYENKANGYKIDYPSDWHIFTFGAESDFSDETIGDNQAIRQGGSVFWSNKNNIDFTEETMPDDFRLLGLLTYEKQEIGIDEFAKFLGFTDEAGASGLVFKARNIIGKEFISAGATEKDPRVAVIFKNNDRFFVFHLGFIGEDSEALKTMEGIAGTFRIVE